ncbi:TrbI/VirB10 family protein [Cupriavidus pauculus]|uniref:TrbI/VirB10 family protein n=1 Tax=Cupriavidus pauculus TaxID=82633 RepID=UPI001EE26C18|nr:TrbI/VirB10 family protein [Cupriavidus pauculus]GJG97758.1 TrbI/VirB10 family protein [Cupriavidus pauculus]
MHHHPASGKAKPGEAANATDARLHALKGKLPRNVVLTFGAIAAMAVGALGYYFQSVAEAQLDAKAEHQRAERLRQGAAGSPAAQSARTLEQTIRDQAEKARAESASQAATQAISTPRGQSTSPIVPGQETLPPSARAASPAAQVMPWISTNAVASHDSTRSVLAEVSTAPVFKPGARPSQLSRDAATAGVAGIPNPQQMHELQQAVAMRAAANAMPAGDAQSAMGEGRDSADRRFLADAAGGGTLRTGFDGMLPPCTVSRGFVIPAVFAGALNSDKPGEFRATVARDVYDTVHGTCKVIPAGSTLVGMYSADIAVGQERILAAFVRMQLPNGKTVPLMGMQAADPNGQSGVSGEVDNHFWKIFGGALLVGLLEQRFDDTSTGTAMGPTGLITYGNAAGQIATQTASTLLNRNQGIRPTITTTPGQQLLVQVKHDMVLEAYRD